MWIRSKSKAAKETPKFRELDVPRRNTLIKYKSLSSINTLKASLTVVPSSPLNIIVTPKMANPIPNIYPTWDDGVPLTLAILHEILTNIFKTLPKFDATIERIAYEHCMDVANLTKTHNIQHEYIMVRLLALSFKGKVLDWY